MGHLSKLYAKKHPTSHAHKTNGGKAMSDAYLVFAPIILILLAAFLLQREEEVARTKLLNCAKEE